MSSCGKQPVDEEITANEPVSTESIEYVEPVYIPVESTPVVSTKNASEDETLEQIVKKFKNQPVYDYESIWKSIVKMPQIDFTGHNALNFDSEEKQYLAAALEKGQHMDFFEGIVAVTNKRPYYNQRPCVYIVNPERLEYMTQDGLHLIIETKNPMITKHTENDETTYVVSMPCSVENTSTKPESLYGWCIAYGIIQNDSDDMLRNWCGTISDDWYEDALNNRTIQPGKTEYGRLYYTVPEFMQDSYSKNQLGYNRVLIVCRIDGFSNTMTRAYIGNFDIERNNNNADTVNE